MKCTVKEDYKVQVSDMATFVLRKGQMLNYEQFMMNDRVSFKLYLTPRISKIFSFHVFEKAFKR